MGGNKERLVMIGVAHDEVEASIWRDILEREGVPVYVKSADPLTPFGVPPLSGSLQLFVRSQDERRARWLLGDRTENAGASA